MTFRAIEKAIAAAKELVRRGETCLKEIRKDHGDRKDSELRKYGGYCCGTRASGSLRRQSLELTRTLADLRGSGRHGA